METNDSSLINDETLKHLTKPNYYVVKANQDARPPIGITGQQLLEGKTEQIPFLLEGVLQQTGLACLAGSSDTGKSCLLRQLAVAVSVGDESFIGFKLNTKHRSAIYVSTEDGREATAFLLSKQSKQHLPEKLRELYFVFDFGKLQEELDKELARKPADIVVIDCFQDAYGEDLKDSQQIRIFLNRFQEMAEKRECLFLFLHHTGKRTENHEPSKNNLLSGQGLEAKMRLVIELRADLMNPMLRHLCIVKGNYLSSSSKKESYVLAFDESSFTFSNTGERMGFEGLVKKEGVEEDKCKEKYLRAAELKQEGLSYEKIADRMGVSLNTIARLFKKARIQNWGMENEGEQF